MGHGFGVFLLEWVRFVIGRGDCGVWGDDRFCPIWGYWVGFFPFGHHWEWWGDQKFWDFVLGDASNHCPWDPPQGEIGVEAVLLFVGRGSIMIGVGGVIVPVQSPDYWRGGLFPGGSFGNV